MATIGTGTGGNNITPPGQQSAGDPSVRPFGAQAGVNMNPTGFGNGLGNGAGQGNGPVSGMALPQITNGMVSNYQAAAPAIKAVAEALTALNTAMNGHKISWTDVTAGAEGAATKYKSLADSLRQVTEQLGLLSSHQNLLTKLHSVTQSAPGAAAAVNQSAGMVNAVPSMFLMADGPKRTIYSSQGFNSTATTGNGPAQHELFQGFTNIRSQLVKSFSSATTSIDENTVMRRKNQLDDLLKEHTRLMGIASGSIQSPTGPIPEYVRKTIIDNGNLERLGDDLRQTSTLNMARMDYVRELSGRAGKPGVGNVPNSIMAARGIMSDVGMWGFGASGNRAALSARVGDTMELLKGDYATHQSVGNNPQATASDKESAQKKMEQLTASMKQLQGVATSLDKPLSAVGGRLASIAGMAVGIYGLSHAMSQAVAKAIEFDAALRKVDVMLQRIPQASERLALGSSIKQGAMEDALTYGVDINQAVTMRTTAMLSSSGSMNSRARLSRTMAQMAFTGNGSYEDLAGLVTPLTNSGLDASQINQFMQTSQVLQGQRNMTPDRFKAYANAVTAGAAGLGSLTDWETLQAASLQEATATRDGMRFSRLNRVQTAFRSPQTIKKLEDIISRHGDRASVGEYSVGDIVNSGSPMMSIDRISQLYRSGQLSDAEVSAVAQTIDKRSGPSMMNLLHTGLDDWRGQVREASAVANGGFVSTDSMAATQATSMQSSIARITNSLGALATGGLDPLARGMKVLADVMAGPLTLLGKTLNSVVAALVAFGTGLAVARGVSALGAGMGKIAQSFRDAGDGNSIGSGLFKAAGGLGGVVGLGLGLATTAYSLYSEHKAAQEQKVVDANTEASTDATVQNSKDLSKARSLTDAAKELRDAYESGNLTLDRKLGLTQRIATAIGNEKIAANMVSEILAGQTTELRTQLGLLEKRNGTVQISAATAMMMEGSNYFSSADGTATADLNNDPTLKTHMQWALKVMRDNKDHLPTALAAAMSANNNLGYQAMESGDLLDLLTAFRNAGEDPGLAAIANEGGKRGTAKDHRVAMEANARIIGATWVQGTLSNYDSGNATAKDKSGYVKAHFDSEVLPLYKAIGVEGSGVTLESLAEARTHSFGKDGKKLTAAGAFLNLQDSFEDLQGFTESSSVLKGILGHSIGATPAMHKLGDQGSAVDFAKLVFTHPDVQHYLEAADPAAFRALARFQDARTAVASIPGNPIEPDKKMRPYGAGEVMSAWHGTYSSLSSAGSRGDSVGVHDYSQRLPGGSFDYLGTNYSIQKAYEHDAAEMRKSVNAEEDLTPEDKARKIQAEDYKLQEHRRELESYDRMNPVLQGDARMASYKKNMSEFMAFAKPRIELAHANLLGSADPYSAKWGELFVKSDQIMADREEAPGLAKKNELTDRQIDAANLDRHRQLMNVRNEGVAMLQKTAHAAGDFHVFTRELAGTGLYTSDKDVNARKVSNIRAQEDEDEKILKLLQENGNNLEDQVEVTKRLVALKKQEIELDEDVIRARKAHAVGMQVQGEIVHSLFDLSKGATVGRNKGLIQLAGSTINQGLMENANRALNGAHNPLAQIAAFMFDPTGAMNKDAVQGKLVAATEGLRQEMIKLNAKLVARAGESAANYSLLGTDLAGFTPEMTGFSFGSFGNKFGTAIPLGGSSPAFMAGTGGSISAAPSLWNRLLSGNLGSSLSSALESDPAGTSAKLKSMGFSPESGDTFTPAEVQKLQSSGALAQAVKANPDKAKSSGVLDLVSGGKGTKTFWDPGGAGRAAGPGKGLFSTPDSPGLSGFGVAVGSSQMLMGAASGYYGNRGNGQGAQNYAALSGAAGGASGAAFAVSSSYAATATAAGADTTAGLAAAGTANSWNVAGWVLLAAAAVSSVLSSLKANKNEAEMRNNAYAQQVAAFQRTVALQEEQKRAMGLLAEKLMSMRGDVGNVFQGIASSAFLSGRWAGGTSQINVANLTVQANNPAELSAALTGALSAQMRRS